MNSLQDVVYFGMHTRHPRMKQFFHTMTKAARSEAPILIRGETGTGKELVAQAIHQLSARKSGPFRALNCAALPAPLLESELFGHVRGAFTGAVKDTLGHIQLAHDGTLFLDEVAEMPLELQAKLLRVLETRTVTPVGGRQAIPVNIRLLSATHRSLRQDVAIGRFRADLMYRIRVIPLFLPALRERKEDIPLLSNVFFQDLQKSLSHSRVQSISPGTYAALENYNWPGNIRELRNALYYALAMAEASVLQPDDLPPEIIGEDHFTALINDDTLHIPEAQKIADALKKAKGHRQKTAVALGISRITLWRKMNQYHLSPLENQQGGY